MKKCIALLMALLLALACAGCGGDQSGTEGTQGTNGQTTQGSQNKNDGPYEGEVTEAVVRNYKVAAESDFEYEETAEGILIAEYIGSDTVVVIPETINGKPVVAIANIVFGNDSTVRGVKIPSGVKELAYTFTNNTRLEVVIWESAEVAGEGLFNSCTGLHTVIFGDGLKTLGLSAFFYCANLKELYIPATVESVDPDIAVTIFSCCDALTIKGEAGSYIESFCAEYGIPFEAA